MEVGHIDEKDPVQFRPAGEPSIPSRLKGRPGHITGTGQSNVVVRGGDRQENGFHHYRRHERNAGLVGDGTPPLTFDLAMAGFRPILRRSHRTADS